MKKAILLVFLLSLIGCTSSINELTLPPASTISGQITAISPAKIFVRDMSGSITLIPNGGVPPGISVGDTVTAYGSLSRCFTLCEGEYFFAPYAIETAYGDLFVFEKTGSYFAVIMQTGFK
ncbi:hypothetical protein ACMXYR_03775 [Neptuniibacter sp. QD29_5]|uniref:hypothetical protein n=1 Tax=Neptuniibacter sp. QD29_5 TaxID=3398207 RepID=UPI0039F577F4